MAPLSCPEQRLKPVQALGDDQALAWFVRLNRPHVTRAQRLAFRRWLSLDPDHRRSYDSVKALWQRLGPQAL